MESVEGLFEELGSQLSISKAGNFDTGSDSTGGYVSDPLPSLKARVP